MREDGCGGRTAAEAGWHESRYNLRAAIPGSRNVAIYNTLGRSCAAYTPLELYLMSALDEIPESHPLVARLARRGVIANHDEREALEAERRLEAATPPDGAVFITICPTMACNFECPYCFANLGTGKMDPEVRGDVVALAERMLRSSGAGRLVVTWFGGEPLLALDVIEALSARLIALADERGARYESWIFTNGYLLSEEVVGMLLRCRVTHVHIPFDGVGATHDATRRLVGGGPMFQRLVENLDYLRPPIKAHLRANTHAGNVGELDELKRVVTGRAEAAGNRLDFYAANIEMCRVEDEGADDRAGQMAAYAYDGIEVALRPESRRVPVGKDHRCVAQNLWMVAVDDEGLLYKCGGKLCGQPAYSFGTARDWDPARPLATAGNPDMLSRFLNTGTIAAGSACGECVWLPICGGGCPQLRLIGRRACPPYRDEPERFVLAMYDRIGR